MAAWPDGRKVCLALPLLGLLLFGIYSITLRETKTTYEATQSSYDNVLFELDNRKGNSNSDKLDSSSQMRMQDARVEERSERLRQRRLPNAIIIGVRKGGTRALLQFLKVHPKIKTCSYEVHFFDKDENYSRGLDWYREKMPESKSGDITIEKTPAYFVTDKVPRRVYHMSWSIKLIVILRDPTERAISDYVQVQSKKVGVSPPFEKFVTKDKEQKVLKTSLHTLSIGVYIKHLRNWLNFFPISQIHFVSMEELTRNPAVELQAVEKFLHLEPFIKEEHFYVNETKRFPCLTGHVQGRSSENSGCLSEQKGRPHPFIADGIRKLLQDYYRPYNQELYKEVHRDFGWP